MELNQNKFVCSVASSLEKFSLICRKFPFTSGIKNFVSHRISAAISKSKYLSEVYQHAHGVFYDDGGDDDGDDGGDDGDVFSSPL